MADDAATTTDDAQITFNVKAANDQKHVLTLPSATTIADLKAKLSTSEYADVPAERQRLIYSGRVLKDPDTLASVKIKDGHTVHLVKGAASNARQNPASQGTTSTTGGGGTPTPQVPTNIAAGTGNNPLAGLTGARYAGFHGLPGMDMFGPDGGMGPPPTTESMLEQMENPMFLSQMNEAMNNPAVVDMMLQSPMIRDNPMLQQVLRDPEMRRMMFSPEMMRMQLRMQRNMGGGAPGGAASFPAPGATDNTPGSTAAGQGATATPNQPNTGAPADPFAALGGGAGGANPFASLFAGGQNPFAPQQPGANAGAAQNTQDASSTFPNLFGGAGAQGGQANPIAEAAQRMMQNPEAMRNMMQMMGGAGGAGANPFGSLGETGAPAAGGAAANPFAALFGPGGFGGAGGFGTPPPADTRPPEEVYETQLRQLNEMGFYEFERNVSALRRSGGNVQGAIEYLLNGGA
ncbi:Deubiquitination-protection protein dph1 [Pyrenophora teres f. maculata]|nr:Deubiquitination-protection protein dph1 [Pyrenophora teres f. maculata]